MEILRHRSYRTLLKNELEQRIAKNHSYSLRAFARDIGISPQMLSLVLSGKKNISPDIAGNMIEGLELNPDEASHFLDLVMMETTGSIQVRQILENRIQVRQENANPSFKSLDLEIFKVISDWHHFAILALADVADFKSDPKWISERLGISPFEVTQAIERLQRLELLEQDSSKKLKRTSLNLTATYESPTTALRKLARQLLEKGIESLESQSISERDITNITMAVNPARIPEAKKQIAQFRRRLCKLLSEGNCTEVYAFSPALFKLTKSSGVTK